jgi:F0F1-type ATP synthase assembly protein I
MPEGRQQPPSPVQYLGAGLTWVGSTGLFMYLGSLLDRHWQSEPAFTVAGAFVGGAAGFYYLYRRLVAGTRPRDKRETDRKK